MNIREIDEGDVDQTIEVYRAVYGDDFPFQEFYDARWVKKGVFDDEIAWFVGEDDEGVNGSAAVMLNVGDVDDLIGEFGRLVVKPGTRSKGAGTQLFEHCVEYSRDRIEFGFAECRVVHPGAQKICSRLGFVNVGFEPLAYALGDRRESVAFFALLSESAGNLRRNNPRVIPSVYPLACLALERCGLPPDVVAVGDVEGYPIDDQVEILQPHSEHMYRLLRIGSGRSINREIFGGLRLETGYLKLARKRGEYLVACREAQPVGAVGFVHDPIDSKVIITELIALSDAVKGALLTAFLKHIPAINGDLNKLIDATAVGRGATDRMRWAAARPSSWRLPPAGSTRTGKPARVIASV